MRQQSRTKQVRKKHGFTLIEAVIGIALVAIAVLGLAEMFTVSVLNNLRSERITNASYLAQQQIDVLRNLTIQEILDFNNSINGVDLNNPPDSILDIMKDQPLDLNGDGRNDYRRLTRLQPWGGSWEVEVLVFSAEQLATAQALLFGDPAKYRVKARVSTIISR